MLENELNEINELNKLMFCSKVPSVNNCQKCNYYFDHECVHILSCLIPLKCKMLNFAVDLLSDDDTYFVVCEKCYNEYEKLETFNHIINILYYIKKLKN